MSKLIRVNFAGAAARRRLVGESGGMGEEIAALRREIGRALGKVDRMLDTLKQVEDGD